MKLRNKKTGKVIENACIGVFKHQSSGDCERIDTEARSLEKVLEEWEDYKPKEPLIEDEKIRKAVRAWAEACDVERCHYDGDGDFATRWHGIKLDGSGEQLEEGNYTIAELCGEEEE